MNIINGFLVCGEDFVFQTETFPEIRLVCFVFHFIIGHACYIEAYIGY